MILLALLLSGTVRAQAHGPSSAVGEQPEPDPAEVAVARATKLADLDIWLRRLAGQFSYEGIKDPGTESARGNGNCIGIGTGPGVQCMIYVSVPSTHGDPGLATMEPAVMLYGVDTNAAGIRSMRINSKGIPETALGFLKGNMAVFKLGCVNVAEWPPCRRFVRIEAAPAGKFIYMWDDTEMFVDVPSGGKDWVRVAGLLLTLRRAQADSPEPARGR